MAIVNNTCVGCDPNCAACSSTNLGKCFTCNSKYLLLDNTCYTSCPVNYVADVNKTNCYYVAPIIVTPVPTNTPTPPNPTNNTLSNSTQNTTSSNG